MMMISRYIATPKHLFILFVLLFPNLSKALGQNIKVEIIAPQTVMVGEQFRVSYIVESTEGEVKEPIVIKNMPDFTIVYGPSLSISNSSAIKKGKRETTYSAASIYVLEATKTGKYSLPIAEVTINGKRYKPKEFKVEVKSTDDYTQNIEAFIKVELSKTNVNLSDTLMMTYKLYTTKEISHVANVSLPSIREFYTRDIANVRQSFSNEIVNGKKYMVVDLRRLILQPRSIGAITIPEGQITVEYTIPTGRKVEDIWGAVYEETIKSEKTLPIDSVIIRVQDLKEI